MTIQDIQSYYSNLLLLQYLSSQSTQTITTIDDVSGSLAGTYFSIYDGASGAGSILWNKVGGMGTAPVFTSGILSTYTIYEVDFATNSDANTIASAINSVVATVTNFTPSVSQNIITLTNATTGPFAIAIDFTTGFSFSKNNAVETIQATSAPIFLGQLPAAIQNAFQIGLANWNNAPNWISSQTYNNGQQVFLSGIVYQSNIDGNENNNPTNNNYYWTPIFQPSFGVQLDTIAKYVGVTRSGVGVYQQPITLNDSDFTQLIILGIASNNLLVTNSNGTFNYGSSSLYVIDNFLQTYFPNEIFVFDGENMTMSYLLTTSVGSENLVQMMITQGLLPKPMGVDLASIIIVPNLGLFSFTDYDDWTIVAGSPVNNVAAWSSTTTYSLGQQVYDISTSILYASAVNNNLNNAITNISFWTPVTYPATDYSTFTNYTQTPAYIGNWHWLQYEDTVSV
jgi:hypothetical protein